MNPAITQCPICQSDLEIVKLYCRSCDTSIEGHFQHITPFQQLTSEQMSFMVTFVRSEGKINRVEEELGISYPTVRSRLHDLIRALGYEVGEEEEPTGSLPEEERRSILDALSKGTLSSEDALKRLSGKGQA
jgi:hypothetical protein